MKFTARNISHQRKCWLWLGLVSSTVSPGARNSQRSQCSITNVLSHSLDPIWTIKTGSLFLLEVESEHLFLEDGMKFLVKDFDQFGSNETLGLVHVPPRTLYLANGERMEFKLQPVPGKTVGEVPGYLAIRCRRATTYDKTFMEGMQSSMKAIAAPKLPKSQGNAIKSMVTKTSKIENGVKKVSHRPCYHEPNCCSGYSLVMIVQSTTGTRPSATRSD